MRDRSPPRNLILTTMCRGPLAGLNRRSDKILEFAKGLRVGKTMGRQAAISVARESPEAAPEARRDGTPMSPAAFGAAIALGETLVERSAIARSRTEVPSC